MISKNSTKHIYEDIKQKFKYLNKYERVEIAIPKLGKDGKDTRDIMYYFGNYYVSKNKLHLCIVGQGAIFDRYFESCKLGNFEKNKFESGYYIFDTGVV